MIQLAPSILAADFSQLGQQVRCIEEGGAHLIHVDVMDGHFVPNISFGADDFLEDFITPQTEYITVHQEACVHLHRTLQHIRAAGAKAGVSINPATPLCMLDEVLEEVDLILIMSVNPGFGGQKMIPSALHKIEELKRCREKHGLSYRIEIDGGVNLDNIARVAQAGTDIIVAGSVTFGAEDIAGRVRDLIRCAQVNG